MGLKVSGAFQAQIGGAVKYGLIASSKGTLSITQLYKDYKLAYTDEDAQSVVQRMFLNVPVFRSVYEKFVGSKLPTDILDKFLIKEFGVEENIASRVAGYLVDGARMGKLIGEDGTVVGGKTDITPRVPDPEQPQEDDSKGKLDPPPALNTNEYSVHFRGPGMDSKITVHDEDDLAIVLATLNKVKKKLGEAIQASPNLGE
jgi:hypothetical protein